MPDSSTPEASQGQYEAGNRRRRPPEGSPPPSTTPHKRGPQTPKTTRVAKKVRTMEGSHTNHAEAPSPTPQNSIPREERSPTPTPHPTTTTHTSVDVDLYQRLVERLKAATATATALLSDPTATPEPLYDDLMSLGEIFLEFQDPDETADDTATTSDNTTVEPQSRTYANAARKAVHTRNPNPDGQATPGPNSKKPRSRPPPPVSDTRTPALSPASRLILRYDTPPVKPPHPYEVRSALNEALPPNTRVAGVNYSRRGHVVLHARAPSSAASLMAHKDTILKVVESQLRLGVEPKLDLGERWHKVVCHRVPIPRDKQGERLPQHVGHELARWNDVDGEGRDYLAGMALCQKEVLGKRDFLTIRITVKREETAKRLCSTGAFLFGSHCRVSVYRPRRNGAQD
jgi:hypothetical protein